VANEIQNYVAWETLLNQGRKKRGVKFNFAFSTNRNTSINFNQLLPKQGCAQQSNHRAASICRELSSLCLKEGFFI